MLSKEEKQRIVDGFFQSGMSSCDSVSGRVAVVVSLGQRAARSGSAAFRFRGRNPEFVAGTPIQIALLMEGEQVGIDPLQFSMKLLKGLLGVGVFRHPYAANSSIPGWYSRTSASEACQNYPARVFSGRSIMRQVVIMLWIQRGPCGESLLRLGPAAWARFTERAIPSSAGRSPKEANRS